MALKNILKVTSQQYQDLIHGRKVLVNNKKYFYDANTLYIIDNDKNIFWNNLRVWDPYGSDFIDLNVKGYEYLTVTAEEDFRTRISKAHIDLYDDTGPSQLLYTADYIKNYEGYEFYWPSNSGEFVLTRDCIADYSDEYMRIWNMPDGVYKWTRTGAHQIYYNGSYSNYSYNLGGSMSPSATTNYIYIYEVGNYKSWITVGDNGYFYCGYTSSSSGTYYSIGAFSNIKTSHRTLYNHYINLYATKSSTSESFEGHFVITNSSSTAYTASTFNTYLINNQIRLAVNNYVVNASGNYLSAFAIDYGYRSGHSSRCTVYCRSYDSPSSTWEFELYTSSTSGQFYIGTFKDVVIPSTYSY